MAFNLYIQGDEGGYLPVESIPPGYSGPVFNGVFNGEEYNLVPIDPAIVSDPALQYGPQGSVEYQLASLGRLGGGLSNPAAVSQYLKAVAPNFDWSNAIQNAYSQQVSQFGSGFVSGADDPAQTALKIVQASDLPNKQQATDYIRSTSQFAQSQAMGAASQQYAQQQNLGTTLGIPNELIGTALGAWGGPLGIMGVSSGMPVLDAVINQALSQGIMNGEIDPESLAKTAVLGVAAPEVTNILKKAGLSPEVANILTKTATGAITGGLPGALQSGVMGAVKGLGGPTFPQEYADFPIEPMSVGPVAEAPVLTEPLQFAAAPTGTVSDIRRDPFGGLELGAGEKIVDAYQSPENPNEIVGVVSKYNPNAPQTPWQYEVKYDPSTGQYQYRDATPTQEGVLVTPGGGWSNSPPQYSTTEETGLYAAGKESAQSVTEEKGAAPGVDVPASTAPVTSEEAPTPSAGTEPVTDTSKSASPDQAALDKAIMDQIGLITDVPRETQVGTSAGAVQAMPQTEVIPPETGGMQQAPTPTQETVIPPETGGSQAGPAPAPTPEKLAAFQPEADFTVQPPAGTGGDTSIPATGGDISTGGISGIPSDVSGGADTVVPAAGTDTTGTVGITTGDGDTAILNLIGGGGGGGADTGVPGVDITTTTTQPAGGEVVPPEVVTSPPDAVTPPPTEEPPPSTEVTFPEEQADYPITESVTETTTTPTDKTDLPPEVKQIFNLGFPIDGTRYASLFQRGQSGAAPAGTPGRAGAGELDPTKTGKKRQNVWNVASLKNLRDALGI
jgi:hypothetical protein